MSHRGRPPKGWRRVALGGVLAVMGPVLAACGPSGSAAKAPPVTAVPAEGGTVTVGIDQAPTGCNPNTQTGDTAADRLVLSAVLPSAFTVDADGTSQYDPSLIVSAELQSTSPETIVYTLNPKAVWSDGVPITATDLIYAWQHQRAVPLTAGDGDADVASTAGYQDISSMTPSNHGRTLTVVFATPYADWQSLFSELLPAHVLEKTGWSPSCSTVDPQIDLSGGPFELASVGPRQIVLRRNPRWWGAVVPKLTRIVIKVATGPTQLASWLYRGRIDVSLAGSFGFSYLDAVTSTPSIKSEVDVSDTFLQLEFATATGPTANQLVRQGIAYGIDRQSLLDRAVAWADVAISPATSHVYAQEQPGYPASPSAQPANTATTTTTTTTAPGAAALSGASFPTSADLDQQARLLDGAGYLRGLDGVWTDIDGHPLALRLVIDEGDGWAAETGPMLADDLRADGFSVTTTAEPTAAATGQALAAGAADLALLPFEATAYPSLTESWYTPLLEVPGAAGEQDWSNYTSVKVDQLYVQASAQLDPVTAQPLYDQIDQQLWSDMVALPLFAEPTSLAWSNRVTGIVAGQNDDEALFATVADWARLVEEPLDYHGTPKIGP